MIYEPLPANYKVKELYDHFDRLLQDVCREHNERQAELSRDCNREIIDIRREYNIAKQKR